MRRCSAVHALVVGSALLGVACGATPDASTDAETGESSEALSYADSLRSEALFPAVPVDAAGRRGFRVAQTSMIVEQVGAALNQAGVQFSLELAPGAPTPFVPTVGSVFFSGTGQLTFGIYNAIGTSSGSCVTMSPAGYRCTVPYTPVVGTAYALAVEETSPGQWRGSVTPANGARVDIGTIQVPAGTSRITRYHLTSSASGQGGTCDAQAPLSVRFGLPVADGTRAVDTYTTEANSCPGAFAVSLPATSEVRHQLSFTTHATYTSLTGDFDGNGRRDWATVSPNALGAWSQGAALELGTTNQACGASVDCPAGTTCNGGICGVLSCTTSAECPSGAQCVAGTCSSSGSFTSFTWNTRTPADMRSGGSESKYTTVAGDFNADGKTDLATLSPNATGGWKDWIAVDTSTGTGFSQAHWAVTVPADMRSGGPTKSYRTYTGDFNGDGRTDLVTTSQNGAGGWASWVDVTLSTGTGFKTQHWATGTPADMRSGGTGSRYINLVGDFNGDHRSDLATVSPDASGGWASWVDVDLSTGTGFTHQRWTTTTPQSMRNEGSGHTYWVYVGDFNGDGKSDLATTSPDATGGWGSFIIVDISSGTGFKQQRRTSTIPGLLRSALHPAASRVVVDDFDADGIADVALVSPGNTLVYEVSRGSTFVASTPGSALSSYMGDGGPDKAYKIASGFGPGSTPSLCVMSATADGPFATGMVCNTMAVTGATIVHRVNTPSLMRSGLF